MRRECYKLCLMGLCVCVYAQLIRSFHTFVQTSRRHVRKGQADRWIPNVVDAESAYGAALRKASQMAFQIAMDWQAVI